MDYKMKCDTHHLSYFICKINKTEINETTPSRFSILNFAKYAKAFRFNDVEKKHRLWMEE